MLDSNESICTASNAITSSVPKSQLMISLTIMVAMTQVKFLQFDKKHLYNKT